MKRLVLYSVATLLALGACSDSANRTLTGPENGLSFAVSGTEGAIIATDKDDYAPGENVTISGTGWAADETVHLTLTEEPVRDGTHEWDVVADAEGNFTDRSFTPGSQHIGVTFTLAARGEVSGSATQLTFKDGNIKARTSGLSAATDITVSWRKFNGATCSGAAIQSGSNTRISSNPDVLVDVDANFSLEITAPAVADNKSFSSWSLGATIPATPTGITTCVAGTNGAQDWYAIYGAVTPTAISAVSGTGTYEGTGTLTATLKASNVGLSGRTIEFKLNNAAACGSSPLPACPSTNASGVATLAGVSMSGFSAGTQTNAITATFAGDATNGTSTAQGNLVVGKADQTINLTGVPQTAGYNTTFTPSASASSGLAVTIAVSGVCTRDAAGGVVTMTSGTGECTVTASQAGNGNYNAATNAVSKATAEKANQTIDFSPAPPTSAVYNTSFAVAATATSGLTVAISATGACSGTSTITMTSGTGTCTVTGSQAGNGNYNAATSAVYQVAAQKASQVISFTSTAPSNAVYKGAAYSVTADASSELPVSFSIKSGSTCTLTAPNIVNMAGAGSCTVVASQAGNANFDAAANQEQSFQIGKAAQAITFTSTAPSNAVFGGSDYTVGATADSDLPVSFSVGAGSKGCSISGSVVSFIGAAVAPDACIIVASQEGDDNYEAAPTKSQSFTIAKATPTVVAGGATHDYDGQPHAATATVTGVGGVALTSPAATFTYNGLATTPVNAGTYAVVARFAGNYDYNSASSTNAVNVVINKVNLIVTADDQTKTYDGQPFTAFTVNYDGFVNGETVSVLGGTLGFDGTAVTAVDANANGVGTLLAGKSAYAIVPEGLTATNYQIAYVDGKLLIKQRAISVISNSASAIVYGDATPSFHYSLTGSFVGSDESAFAATLTYVLVGSTSSNGVLNAGTYQIVPSWTYANTNYAISPVTPGGSLTVNPRPVAVRANDAGPIYYGGPVPSFSWSLGSGSAGFLGSDQSAFGATVTFQLSTSITPVPVGTHTITPAWTYSNGNYAISLATPAGTLRVLAWTVSGFYQPVDMSGGALVWNTVKGGSTVPLKFEVFSGNTERTDVGTIKSFTQTRVTCANAPLVDEIEIVTTGGTTLRYDTTGGQFIQNWQTPKQPGACYRATATMQDGSPIVAYFLLK